MLKSADVHSRWSACITVRIICTVICDVRLCPALLVKCVIVTDET